MNHSINQMATFQEIVHLLSDLASQVNPPSSNDVSIAKLTQSLNLESPQLRVLDTALSLMCFKAPQVFDSVIEYSVKTIVSVLSSSTGFKVSQKDEVLQIGSSVSRRDCLQLTAILRDVIPKLEGHGVPSDLLLSAVVRAIASASCCGCSVPPARAFDVESIGGLGTAMSTTESPFGDDEIPLRLLFWYLDPLSLKRDISKILQETIKRCFLSLSKEFYERMEWRSILVCLLLSPPMFIHTRALLHDWFLRTGLNSILELLIQLISMVLDVISRPTWWGISMELGSRLPFSHAYFPYNNQLLRTLGGPISDESFLDLVHQTSGSVPPVRDQFGPRNKPSSGNVVSIDHKSAWALAISFPEWFYFALVLLFFDGGFQEKFDLKCTSDVPRIGQKHSKESSAAAAGYIAWILSPTNKHHQDLLHDSLTKVSKCWTLKQIDLDNHETGKASYKKKLKKPKTFGKNDDSTLGEYDYKVIRPWLKEFQNVMEQFADSAYESASCKVKSHVSAPQQNMLLRRIPLGILIGCPNHLSEAVWELLLHNVVTGSILHSVGAKNDTTRSENAGGKEDTVLDSNEPNEKEAVSGACLIFNLTDIVERMCTSFFDLEESGLDITSRVKLRVSEYLIKCIKRLIRPNIDEDGILMLMDLHGRLDRWRHQGRELCLLDKDLDDAIEGLHHKLSSIR